MRRLSSILLWLSTVSAATTGCAYAAMRYLIRNDDPFSAYNHPAQPYALQLHVLIAPVLVFVVGWFWGAHVVPKLSGEAMQRNSGALLIVLALTMVSSGYLCQVSADSGLRGGLALLHGVSGTIFSLMLAGHAIVGIRTRGARRGSLAVNGLSSTIGFADGPDAPDENVSPAAPRPTSQPIPGRPRPGPAPACPARHASGLRAAVRHDSA